MGTLDLDISQIERVYSRYIFKHCPFIESISYDFVNKVVLINTKNAATEEEKNKLMEFMNIPSNVNVIFEVSKKCSYGTT